MKRTIYISVLLKDKMIMGYRVGGNIKKYPADYYKDFYYAGIDMNENVDKEYEVKYMSVEIDEDIENKFNNYIFDKLAREYFKQWKIHPNHFGSPAY